MMDREESDYINDLLDSMQREINEIVLHTMKAVVKHIKAENGDNNE